MTTPHTTNAGAANPCRSIRFRYNDAGDSVEIRAKLKATGQYATLGFCHPATVALIRRDGIHPHLQLITLP